MKHYRLFFLSILLVGYLTACYRMPTEDDYSTIPMTNNPEITRDKNTWTPNAAY